MHDHSPKLTRGTGLEREEIRSNVAIASSARESSARLAAHEIASVKSAPVRACVERVLRKRFAGKSIHGVHIDEVRLSQLPISAPGATASVGLRFTMTLTLTHTETTLPAYVDLLAFTSGPAAISLMAVSVIQPEPTATEQQLTSLLLTRARAHAL